MLSSVRQNPGAALTAILAAFLLLASAGIRPGVAQSAGEPTEEEKITKYSLYFENFKTGNYDDAIRDLRWLLENAPTYIGPGKTDDRNFERAIVIYDSLAARAEDEDLARAYLDTALTLHDTALATLKEEGIETKEYRWVLDKGRFIQAHPELMADLQPDAIDYYREAFDISPEEVDPYYVNVLIGSYASRDKMEAIEFIDQVEPQFEDNPTVSDYIAQVRNMLFRTPEERMAFLEQQMEKKPEDVEIISELFDIYRELGHRNKMYEISEKLPPSAESFRIMGKLRLDDGQPQEAFEQYEKAIEMSGEATVQDYYNMGIAQQNMGSLAKARTFFRKALDVDSEFGPAYIAIGDLYATAVAECGSFEREDRAVYWLVVDYYNQAKSADPGVASAADQKIRTYRRSFPDQEALFFKNWEAGQNYRVDYGCYAWINESTTVKTP